MRRRPKRTEEERFWGFVDTSAGPDACWPWTGARDTDGYGMLRVQAPRVRNARASRYAWTLAHGPIPDGLHVLHSCDFRACCNERHLRLGTHQENMTEMYEKGRRPHRGPRGEAHASAKLTATQVIDIRSRHASGWSRRDLAVAFGVTKDQIGNIVTRRAWAHVA